MYSENIGIRKPFGFKRCKYGKSGNNVAGDKIAGFEKVVDAMNSQGID